MVFNSNTDILKNIGKMGILLVNHQKKVTEMNDKLNKNNIDDSKKFKMELISIIILTLFIYIFLTFFFFYMKKI